jgi:hypothetical protein
LAHNRVDLLEGSRRQLGIGMKKDEDIAFGNSGSGIHLSCAASFCRNLHYLIVENGAYRISFGTTVHDDYLTGLLRP